jgi:uncharacterized protein YhaN
MRLRELRLLRYGRFDGTVLAFPRVENDFHLVVGPNEAGKSTLRDAVGDLLFGLPRSSPKALIHHQSTLRLGAVIEQGDWVLSFDRTKSTKASLHRPDDDTPLPDDALAPFLGRADRAFYLRMFALDHGRLVAGGQGILEASDDVGRMLFQSAAGIASLGPVHQQLVDEAASLWTPRKAQDRAWYVAQQRLDEATAERNAATVRPKAWGEAQARRDQAGERLRAAQAQRAERAARRVRLERIRRLAPTVRALQDAEAALTALTAAGPVTVLPADAAARLSAAEADRAAALQLFDARAADVRRRHAVLAGLAVDDAVLAQADAVEALAASRHRLRDHAAELQALHAQAQQTRTALQAAAAALAWPLDEDGLRARRPAQPALRAVSRLAAAHGALGAARDAAEATRARLRGEHDALVAELARTGAAVSTDGLEAVLARATAALHAAETALRSAPARSDASRRLQASLLALAPGPTDLEALRLQPVPAAEQLAAARAARERLADAALAARRVADEEVAAEAAARGEVDRFRAAHRVVGADEVQAARDRRDALWVDVRDGRISPVQAATGLEAATAWADRLADDRLASAGAQAQWEALRAREADAAYRAGRATARCTQADAALAAAEAEAERDAAAAGLAAIPPSDRIAWLDRRLAVLQEADALSAQRAGDARLAADAQAVAHVLSDALAAAGAAPGGVPDGGPPPDPAVAVDDGLPAAVARLALLTALADAHRRAAAAEASAAAVRRRRLDETAVGLREADQALAAATRAVDQWAADWSTALAAAGLDAQVVAPADAAAAVEAIERVGSQLDRLDELRDGRIAPLQSALGAFVAQAAELAARLGQALDPIDAPTAGAFAAQAEARLRQARADALARDAAAAALTEAQASQDAAAAAVQDAQARVAGLLALAGVDRLEDARPRVERSDRYRAGLADREDAQRRLRADGDGLAVDVLVAEIAVADLQQVSAEAASVEAELLASDATLVRLAADDEAARAAFDAIDGGADAALAEARRQEALEEMADVAERWLKVQTASRLLRWAIDRYRDRQQGPLLARAGTLFARITLGRFERLVVDHEAEPARLLAVRAGGSRVEVGGLSEGTRDQLYLVLRLAALELHLDHAPALPFVADDLFVNFDDERARAGLDVLRELSRRTQVVFLTHHAHLLPLVREVFGQDVPVHALARWQRPAEASGTTG